MEIDPRGPRFGAVITAVVLAAVLVTRARGCSPPRSPCSRWARCRGAVRALRPALPPPLRPRLGPPAHTEAEAPPRFSQGVGMVFAGVAFSGRGRDRGRPGLTALALVAAFLNAAFDLCLGCQMYLFIQRNLRVRPSA